MSNYLQHATSPATQTEQADPRQVKNSAGGFTFALDDQDRLERFLILGSEGGTYYASERKLTRENAQIIEKLAASYGSGIRLVNTIVEISESGRAPKNDPAILALAIAARSKDADVRRAAYAAVPRVCRIGTHLYHFVSFADAMGGWGRGLRRAVASWFNAKTADDLAHQLVKYQQRDGWSARDLLRLSHAKPPSPAHDAAYSWATAGIDDASTVEKLDYLPKIIAAFEEAKTAATPRLLHLIREYKLPREAVPTQHLTSAEVWDALLPHMGLTAMVRNLATMTRVGLIAPLSARAVYVAAKISDAEALRKARVHPIQMLSALRVYSRGHGERGGNTWSPVQPVVDALDAGFYASFASVTPTGKATLLALDVSGSMSQGEITGVPGLSPREASAAMAMVTAAVEPSYHVVGFSGGIRDLPISPRMRLADAIRVISDLPFQRTDCALPFLWAAQGRFAVESFAVYTDNETYAGYMHPHVALQKYRSQSGIAARSAVVGMTATDFTIADPTDPGMMDFVGFDAAAPAVMADFFRGTDRPSRA
jgi:60 kDa SS-A/Ro ribonucleoprotein